MSKDKSAKALASKTEPRQASLPVIILRLIHPDIPSLVGHHHIQAEYDIFRSGNT
jgi:hypothetical protein